MIKSLQPFPGKTGETITLNASGAQPPSPEPFRVGDVCTFGPFAYRFRVIKVEGDVVTFQRES